MFLEGHDSNSLLTCFVLLNLPVLLDTSFLYYTDLLSVTMIIWGYNFSNSTISAFFCFFGSILTRQTNIVWALMYCIMSWLKHFDAKNPIYSTIKIILKHLIFVFLGFSFLLFVYLNGSIVLGDKTAHKPVIHFAQILYFFAFVSFSSFPLFLSELFNKRFWFFVLKKPLILFINLVLFFIFIQYFSLSHQYLLADNRHFTFYLWRKVLNRNELIKFFLLLFYLLSGYYTFFKLNVPFKFFSIFFFFSIILSIVPAHLIEFRYFIVPYTLWRLFVFESKKRLILLELLWSFIINCVCMYLFIMKPFVWNFDSTNAIQRFMW